MPLISYFCMKTFVWQNIIRMVMTLVIIIRMHNEISRRIIFIWFAYPGICSLLIELISNMNHFWDEFLLSSVTNIIFMDRCKTRKHELQLIIILGSWTYRISFRDSVVGLSCVVGIKFTLPLLHYFWTQSWLFVYCQWKMKRFRSLLISLNWWNFICIRVKH